MTTRNATTLDRNDNRLYLVPCDGRIVKRTWNILPDAEACAVYNDDFGIYC
jgi:hypothetical protein